MTLVLTRPCEDKRLWGVFQNRFTLVSEHASQAAFSNHSAYFNTTVSLITGLESGLGYQTPSRDMVPLFLAA